MNENTYINPLAEAEPIMPTDNQEEQMAINFLESLRIHAADRFDKPNFALYKDGIGFAPLGNIMAICSEAKNGKSWLMQQFAVAILKGSFCGLESKLDDPSILYFDTEQDKYDTKMVLNRVHYCCGWDFNEDKDNFKLYSMDVFDCLHKDKTIQENRIEAIEIAIEHYKPKVVFIDGVRDLIHDFNDLAQSADLVQKLMTMSRKLGCLICTVLHVNPNSDKMRGHLGTEMQNKTTDVFTVKKKEEGGIRTFDVKQIAARHQDINSWTFWINDNGKFPIPEVVADSIPAEAKHAQENKWTRDLSDIDRMMKSLSWSIEGMSYTQLESSIKCKGITSKRMIGDYITLAKTNGIISQPEKGGVYYLVYDNVESIDSQTSLDESNEAPF